MVLFKEHITSKESLYYQIITTNRMSTHSLITTNNKAILTSTSLENQSFNSQINNINLTYL